MALLYFPCLLYADDGVEREGSELEKAITRLSYWRTDRKFSTEEWKQYFQTGGQFQRASPAAQERALTIFEAHAAKERYDGIGAAESKAFILLRICFTYPEDKEALTGPWVGPQKRSMLWPLGFNSKGQVNLTALFRGAGTRYRLLNDYKLAIQSKFSSRDLSKIKAPDD